MNAVTQGDRIKQISKAEVKKAILAVEAERLKHPTTVRGSQGDRGSGP